LPNKGNPEFVILADFDGTPLEDVENAALEQIEKRKLSDFFIVTSINKKEHYHLYCPTKVSYDEYEQILLEFNKNGMDSNFMHPFYNWDKEKTTILRFHSPEKGKLKLVKTIKSPHRNKREMSLAHLRFLKCVFGIDINVYHNIDNNPQATVDTYFTSKK